MLFGGLDPSGGITVDKPPAALWLTDLSVRAFGLSTQSLVLPQAVCGVASVALLYGVVRRQALSLVPAGEAADSGREARAAAVALFAAGALAVTPVVTLMARYNNPDALMVTLSLGAAYSLVRSVGASRAGGGWLALAGALMGLAFLTKLGQAWLVLPAFVAVALVAGAGSLWRRLGRVLVAGLAMVVSRRMVGPRRAADPRGPAALDRWEPVQQRARAGSRLQRPRSADRPGRRWRSR